MIFLVTFNNDTARRYEADEIDSFNGQLVLSGMEKNAVTTRHRTVAWFNQHEVVSIVAEASIKDALDVKF